MKIWVLFVCCSRGLFLEKVVAMLFYNFSFLYLWHIGVFITQQNFILFSLLIHSRIWLDDVARASKVQWWNKKKIGHNLTYKQKFHTSKSSLLARRGNRVFKQKKKVNKFIRRRDDDFELKWEEIPKDSHEYIRSQKDGNERKKK